MPANAQFASQLVKI